MVTLEIEKFVEQTLIYLCRFINGDVYEGEFEDNVPFGEGKYIYKDGGIDEAIWEHGVRHGLARYNSIEGTVEEVNLYFFTGIGCRPNA